MQQMVDAAVYVTSLMMIQQNEQDGARRKEMANESWKYNHYFDSLDWPSSLGRPFMDVSGLLLK